MAETDLYAVLEVPRTADADAIKKAYRAMAMKFHPDRNPGNKSAEERFKAINHANDVLGDPKKRALYDEFGEMGLRDGFNPDQYRQYQKWAGGAGGGRGGVEDMFGGAGGGNVDVSDLFEQLFQGTGGPGGRRRTKVPTRGADLEGEITVELPDAIRGIELPLTVNGNSLRVRVPPGVHDGARLRIAGKGQPAPGGRAGDLMLTVHVRPHPSYWVEDEDLHLRLPVSVLEAWNGARVKVPTPGGEVTLRVQPRTNSGTKLRLRQKGIPQGRAGEASDLIVHVEIVLPKEGPGVEEAMRQLEGLDESDPRSELRF
jgi:DnaJ-class molecular chaperone